MHNVYDESSNGLETAHTGYTHLRVLAYLVRVKYSQLSHKQRPSELEKVSVRECLRECPSVEMGLYVVTACNMHACSTCALCACNAAIPLTGLVIKTLHADMPCLICKILCTELENNECLRECPSVEMGLYVVTACNMHACSTCALCACNAAIPLTGLVIKTLHADMPCLICKILCTELENNDLV